MYLYIFKEGKIKGGNKFLIQYSQMNLRPWGLEKHATEVWELASSGFK